VEICLFDRNQNNDYQGGGGRGFGLRWDFRAVPGVYFGWDFCVHHFRRTEFEIGFVFVFFSEYERAVFQRGTVGFRGVSRGIFGFQFD
jgi:hypothetical protein